MKARRKIALLYDEDHTDQALADLLIAEAHDRMDRAEQTDDQSDRLRLLRAAKTFLEEAEYVLTKDLADSRL